MSRPNSFERVDLRWLGDVLQFRTGEVVEGLYSTGVSWKEWKDVPRSQAKDTKRDGNDQRREHDHKGETR